MITVRTSRRPLNICTLDGRLRKARLQKFVSRKTSRISKVKVCGGGGVRSWMGDQPQIGLSTSWSATCLATSRIPSNFFRFEQLFAFWAISLVISNSEISKQLLVLKLAFFHVAQCFSRQFMNFREKKRSQILLPGADHGRKIEVAELLGQRYLPKIQNGGGRFTLDWLRCLGSFNNFIGSLHFLVLIKNKVT